MKSNAIFLIVSLVLGAVFFQHCQSTDNEPQKVDPTFVITGINPETGTAGTAVVIAGTGFSATATDNLVTLNGKACVVTVATAEQLTITIPPDAGTGKIKVALNGKEAESNVFTYTTSSASSACALDVSFDADGSVATDIAAGEPGSFRFVNSNAIQPDGKILVIGESIQANGDRPFVVLRYNADGSPDNSWGGDGQVLTGLPADYDYANAKAIVVQPDNKVVVVGEVKYGNASDMMIVRYQTDGTLDNSFDGDGILVHAPSVPDYSTSAALGVALQSDNKIVVAGVYQQYNLKAQAAVLRLLPNGSPDNTFDSDGRKDLNFGDTETSNVLNDVKLQPDGKIVVSGSAETNFVSVFALARLTTNGALDAAFGAGGSGKQTTKIFTTENRSYSSLIQPDGKILLAGYIRGDGSVSSIGAMVRYNADGSKDESFGSFGHVGYITDVTIGVIQDFVRMNDGKLIICAGWYVARLNANGTPDNSFCDGNYIFKIADKNASLQTLSLQTDNALVASGLHLREEADGKRYYTYYTARYMNAKN
ncbi:IPT/TIG domain-containing protein [Chryseolinea lacunae]|uniref:IPT/TIG domain-containing protein n=1 Tax=Chryseolinea lacunae TaxID=2801331 RepID=A0ABS1KKF7_9BACT|nr:IPT/TIG domain-containing protein [Chryseolinea lacunae]MBL0739938.1 IPT/TIG domain-containing protein [Chryseolinea lacunae]